MIDSNFLNYSCLEPLNVSRETFPELEQFRQTILEKKEKIAKDLKTEAYAHPFVKEVLVQFPAARIVNVVSRKKLEEEAAIQALGEVDSEWNPFEED